MSGINNLKKLIKTIIIDEYENNLYEITDIRKHGIDDKVDDENPFYNNLELDQIIFSLCKIFNLKTHIIRNKHFNNKVKYIIDDSFIYNTRVHLNNEQINNLIIEFNDKNQIKNGKINNFLFLKKYHNDNNVPSIKYLDVDEIKKIK